MYPLRNIALLRIVLNTNNSSVLFHRINSVFVMIPVLFIYQTDRQHLFRWVTFSWRGVRRFGMHAFSDCQFVGIADPNAHRAAKIIRCPRVTIVKSTMCTCMSYRQVDFHRITTGFPWKPLKCARISS